MLIKRAPRRSKKKQFRDARAPLSKPNAMDIGMIIAIAVGVIVLRRTSRFCGINAAIRLAATVPILTDIAKCPATNREAFVDALARAGKITQETADCLNAVIKMHAESIERHFHRLITFSARRMGTVTVMVYPDYGYQRRADVSPERAAIEETVHSYLQSVSLMPSVIKPDLRQTHQAMFSNAVLVPSDDIGTKKTCMSFLAGAIGRKKFAHVALCGHGSAGSIWLRDRTRISQRDVVMAAHAAGFMGHLMVSVNACESDGSDDAWESPDVMGFEWTVISSASGSQKPSNARRFARAIHSVAPLIAMTSPDDADSEEDEEDAPTYRPGPFGVRLALDGSGEDLHALLLRAWDAAASDDEKPEHFIPPPKLHASRRDWRWTGARFGARV
jgi:hypothetical protein